jgi:hypothetical protein
VVGQQDRDAFAALKAAGYHYVRLRRPVGGHEACSVASVQQTAAKAVNVTVWWPSNGLSACAPLGGGPSRQSSTGAAAATSSRGLARSAVVALEGT